MNRLEPTPGFGTDHLPYGSARFPTGRRALVVRVGADLLDLRSVARVGMAPAECDAPNLDRLIGTHPGRWREVREAIMELVTGDRYASRISPFVSAIDEVEMALPFTVSDYVDFYSSEAHATTVGRLFRPDGDPLPANWKHLPIGYHGRSGTVVASGAAITRPSGLRSSGGDVVFGPTGKLDFEVEMGWVVGDVTRGTPTIDDADDRIFGFMPVNDWSARDIQALETAPLGPFLGKSFATSIGAWVTPLAALDGHRVPPPEPDVPPARYLTASAPWAIDVELVASIAPSGSAWRDVARVAYRDLYWTPAQQFAHLTVNGATARPGDLCASGTISGWGDDERGSLLERTADGSVPVDLGDGVERTYLEDGDEVSISATTRDGRLDLGTVSGVVRSAP